MECRLEVEAKFEPIPFDAAAARRYGLVAAAALRKGQHPATGSPTC
jgi:predicted nucleic acid-binding protein